MTPRLALTKQRLTYPFHYDMQKCGNTYFYTKRIFADGAGRQEHITPVALAYSPSTSAVQTGLHHVQVTIWSGPSVLGG